MLSMLEGKVKSNNNKSEAVSEDEFDNELRATGSDALC